MTQTNNEAFQDAKNTLLMARVLSRLENERSSNEWLDKIISEVEKENGYKTKVPLVNQSVYLTVAYSTLLSLRESYFSEKSEAEKILEERVKPLFSRHEINIERGPSAGEIGENAPATFVRRVRNALAHGRVSIEEQSFTFKDEYPKGSENWVEITMSWHALGELTDMVFAAGNDVHFLNKPLPDPLLLHRWR